MRKYKIKLKSNDMGSVRFMDAKGYYEAMAWASMPDDEPEKFALFDDEDDYGVTTTGTLVDADDCEEIIEVS